MRKLASPALPYQTVQTAKVVHLAACPRCSSATVHLLQFELDIGIVPETAKIQ